MLSVWKWPIMLASDFPLFSFKYETLVMTRAADTRSTILRLLLHIAHLTCGFKPLFERRKKLQSVEKCGNTDRLPPAEKGGRSGENNLCWEICHRGPEPVTQSRSRNHSFCSDKGFSCWLLKWRLKRKKYPHYCTGEAWRGSWRGSGGVRLPTTVMFLWIVFVIFDGPFGTFLGSGSDWMVLWLPGHPNVCVEGFRDFTGGMPFTHNNNNNQASF